MKLLTVIIPVYNESKTITKILNKVIEIKISKQIIVVDDCSTDNSRKKILNLKSKVNKIIIHKKSFIHIQLIPYLRLDSITNIFCAY